MTLKDKYNIISYVSERKDGALSRYIYLYSDKKISSSGKELTQEKKTHWDTDSNVHFLMTSAVIQI